MDLGLKNKNALVLASSKGLGKATALALAAEGANVTICGRDKAALTGVVSASNNLKGVIFPVVTDLTSADERSQLVISAQQRFGPIDILVTNSGGPSAGTFQDFDSGDWRAFFELLFNGVADIIQKVLPHMKANNEGRILMISSVTLMQPVDNLIASNAVRTSILGLMKSLANELGSFGITVNTLMPGFTLTDRLKSLIVQNSGV